MSSSARMMHLGLFLLGTGSHVAGWRYPGAIDRFTDIEAVRKTCQLAEAGKFDFIFMGDNLHADVTTHPSYAARFEPMTMLANVAAVTSHIGLGATMSTTYSDPFTVARMFASLDFISGGRAAWNAVTTASPAASANFGTTHPAHSSRYERAEEFIDVVTGLWDCWEKDALVADRKSGIYIDEAKLHPLKHKGKFFDVEGPLNIPRSPQGRPVITQAGGSAPGRKLAARTADVVFSVVQDIDEARSAYTTVKQEVAEFGRSPDDVTFLPGVMPVVGRTDREAFEILSELQGYVGEKDALGLLSDRLGTDMSAYDLDGPVPDLQQADTYHSFSSVMLAKAKRENMTLRDLYNLVASARGHWVLCGSAETVATTLIEWFETRAADGFNIMPPYLYGGLTSFIEGVVPRLQEHGVFRSDYAGTTLRENLGLHEG
ncbi:LLM class flavin-dependent oxidoreductase [Acetobacter musti]|nr:LLM class flavin-dependent oxidoreductase [Acetobacter musti]